MMQQNTSLPLTALVYVDVERAILDQEAADPDWHFGFNAHARPLRAQITPAAMAAYLRSDNLADAQSFAGRMLRRWLRTHDDRRAQFWRDVASALARGE